MDVLFGVPQVERKVTILRFQSPRTCSLPPKASRPEFEDHSAQLSLSSGSLSHAMKDSIVYWAKQYR